MEFLPLLRELAATYQAFENASNRHIRTSGLTPAQFDVIATLGNQPPMTCSELGQKTLITKGTLTGVLDRMAEKGLVRREANDEDGRSFRIALTAEGKELFDRVFPGHIAYLKPLFDKLGQEKIGQIRESLATLRKAFESR
jgi:DNA-binding MarR family transcriptional regulator